MKLTGYAVDVNMVVVNELPGGGFVGLRSQHYPPFSYGVQRAQRRNAHLLQFDTDDSLALRDKLLKEQVCDHLVAFIVDVEDLEGNRLDFREQDLEISELKDLVPGLEDVPALGKQEVRKLLMPVFRDPQQVALWNLVDRWSAEDQSFRLQQAEQDAGELPAASETESQDSPE